MIYPEDYDKIVMIKKEPHYVWPHSYVNGNSTRCEDCRYFVPDLKQRYPYHKTGECHSMAHQTERGYTHRTKGWDKTESIWRCHLWFPIGEQEGPEAELPEEENNGEEA